MENMLAPKGKALFRSIHTLPTPRTCTHEPKPKSISRLGHSARPPTSDIKTREELLCEGTMVYIQMYLHTGRSSPVFELVSHLSASLRFKLPRHY